tara:strand:- start:6801 stop:7235 length:435 start_codon:yes stop_codon:yes gene_type:complete
MKYNYSNFREYFWNTIYLFTKSYPIHNPSKLMKKKYYILFSSISQFIPNEKIKHELETLITKYPITPYLDTRLNLTNWVHFINNKIDIKYGYKAIHLKERQKNLNIIFFPPIKKTFKKKLSIDRKNIIHILIMLLTIYIVYSFI